MTQSQNQPQIEFLPLRAAVSSTSTLTLDVVVKITSPEPAEKPTRPLLNLSLVIDRSGSMASANKLDYAKQAACYAVEQLLASDRVSVVVYDDRVNTLIPSTPAIQKPSIIKKIQQIYTGGSTALHAGWVEGGVQVSQYLNQRAMNRVILLSDGLANVGESNPDVIGSDVHGLMKQGISTTTLGVGNDYNEDLLQSMALSGDGNYYYIESPQQLPTIFQSELQGLLATTGRAVTLGLEPQGQVQVTDVLNDLETTHTGELKLPNLTIGNPFILVLRLKVPPMPLPDNPSSNQADLLALRLSWDAPDQPDRQTLRALLQLPVITDSQLEEFPFNPEVQEQTALMLVARAKREVIQYLDQGDVRQARVAISSAENTLDLCVSDDWGASSALQQELSSVKLLKDDLESMQYARVRKSSAYEAQMRSRNVNADQYDSYLVQKILYPVRDRIQLALGDITTQAVDAIVNPSDASFSGSGSRIDTAVHRVAGHQLVEACRQLSPGNPGEVRLTPGFKLPARWVLHIVSPQWQDGQQQGQELLRQCYQNCLDLAVQHSIATIAFPAIGTDGNSFRLNEAITLALRTAGTFLYKNPSIQSVTFVCGNQAIYDSYAAILS